MRIAFGRWKYLLLISFLLLPRCTILEELQNSEFNPLIEVVKQESLAFANQKLSQQIASKLGFSPILNLSRSDRRLTGSQVRNAKRAKGLFDRYGNGNPSSNSQPELERAKRATRHYSLMTQADINEIEAAYAPLLDRLEQSLDSPASTGMIAVMPHQVKSVRFQGYCLDKGIASPRTSEGFQLLPIGDYLPESTADFYAPLMQYGQEKGQQNQVQGLVWRLVHGVNPEKEPQPLNTNERQILNAAMPSGAQKFESYLQKQYSHSHTSLNAIYQDVARELVQESLDQYLNPAVGSSGIQLNLYRQDLNRSTDINDYLYRLSQIPVEGTVQPNSQFTLLNDEVAVRSLSTHGLQELTLDFLNVSDEPFYYDPSHYIALSTRKTQPVGHYPKDEVEDDPWLYATIDMMIEFFERNPEIAEYLGYSVDALMLMTGVGVVGVVARRVLVRAVLKSPRAKKWLTDLFTPFIRSKLYIKPSALGSTGRTIARTWKEKLAMNKIINNPTLGKALTRIGPLKDSRWKGWTKMSNKNDLGVEIHFNALFKNGRIVKVDDFKFLKP